MREVVRERESFRFMHIYRIRFPVPSRYPFPSSYAYDRTRNDVRLSTFFLYIMAVKTERKLSASSHLTQIETHLTLLLLYYELTAKPNNTKPVK